MGVEKMDYRKIVKVLFDAAKTEKGITYISFNGEEEYVSYRSLLKNSYHLAKKLEGLGAEKGSEIIIQCSDVKNFITSYWACVLGEYVTVPVDNSGNEYVFNENDKILNILKRPYLLYDNKKIVDISSSKISSKIINIASVDFSAAIDVDKNLWEKYTNEDHLMYIQFSSGSMSEPKGALLNCSNIIINIEDIIAKLKLTSKDSFLSWQPLTHCYGLMVFHLAPLAFGIDQYQLRTAAYIKNPLLWMEKVSQHQVTRLGSIPFALKLFMDFYENLQYMPEWNLSCVKSITLGGEQVPNELCSRFNKEMKKFNMDQDILMPGYGMAEATAVVSAVDVHTSYKCYNIGQGALDIGTKIDIREIENSENGYVEVGTPLSRVEVQITDDEGNVLEERTIGHICLRGPSISSGYYSKVDNAETVFFSDGWFDTGDLGFMVGGSITVVGRQKELIVVSGVKYACAAIDEIIQNKLEKIYSNSAVCNSFNKKHKQEEAIVFVQTKFDAESGEDIEKLRRYEKEIKSLVFKSTGLMIERLVPIDEFPKTFSGKIKRREMTNNYNKGLFDEILDKIDAYDESSNVEKKDINIGKAVVLGDLSKDKVKKIIVNIVEELLNFRIEDYDMLFQEYGIVSLNIPSFIQEINKVFGIESDVASVFNFPTINKFSEYIWKQLNGKLTPIDDKGKNAQKANEDYNKIAIVGMSCRFPGGANSIGEFWELLVKGIDGVSVIPEDRWKKDKYYSSDKNEEGKMYCDKGGFLNVPVNAFDAGFFNISPKEAVSLAPEQKMLLELTWEAFENANLKISDYIGSDTGVYIGIASNEYALSHVYSGELSRIDAYSLTGSCFSTACGRLSYTFGFEGPCLAVDTACSSSLTALHLAVQAIKNGETSMAVVAGVNMMLSPSANVGFAKLQATSPDGHCKSFDEDANGYCRSEGCGVIVIKRLEDAIQNNDNILGVIASTAVNQDGKSNGLTAPNGISQANLIGKALDNAGMAPHDVDYIETHGTGTKLGDPIEVSAIMERYCDGRRSDNPLYIGSVKSNIGHMEAAAGMASIIKVLMSMKNNCIPGNLNFSKPNPLINWNSAAIKVVSENMPWEKEGLRRAGINGFGFGGSNAHIIIEEYKKENSTYEKTDGIQYILKLSAKSEDSLNKYADSYINYFMDKKDEELNNIIYNANRGRLDLDCRLSIVGSNVEEIRDKLKAYCRNEKMEGLYSNLNSNVSYLKNRKVLFMYTGQGSVYINMGRFLYETNKIFQDAVNKCDRMFKPYIIKSLVKLIYDENTNGDMIKQTVYAQPLIFTIEYAMSEYLNSIGIRPSAVIGHSIGEYAAAVTAGIMSLETAIKLVSVRGRLMESAPGYGTMGTIFADEKTVNEIIAPHADKVSIAARNTEGSCVISGESNLVEGLLEFAESKGYKTTKLHVSHAFHSAMMLPILDEFESFIGEDMEVNPQKIKFISSLYGRALHDEELLDSTYWTRHISDRVDFYKAITSIEKSDEYIFIEVGADTVLSSICKLIYGEDRIVAGMLNRKIEDKKNISNTIALLYVSGVDICWDKIDFEGGVYSKDILLPTYPFNREIYERNLIYDGKTSGTAVSSTASYTPLLGMQIESPILEDAVIFQSQFTKDIPYFMGEHIIFDTPISPAAAHVSMLVSAMDNLKKTKSMSLSEVEFSAPLAIDGEESRKVQLCFENISKNESKFRITSRSEESSTKEWELHAKGNVKSAGEYQSLEKTLNINEIEKYEYSNINENIYKMMKDSGFELGEGFRRIAKCHVSEGKGICFIKPLSTIPNQNQYIMYPGIIDSVLQTLLCTVYEEISVRAEKETNAKRTIIPYFLGSLVYNYRDFENLWCVATATIKDDIVYGNIEAYNEKGELIIGITDSMGKLTDRNSLLREMKKDNTGYFYHPSWYESVNKLPEYNADKILLVSKDKRAVEKIKYYLVDIKRDIVYLSIEEDDIKDMEKITAHLVENIGQEDKCRILYYADFDNASQNNYSHLENLFNLTQSIIKNNLSGICKLKIITENVVDFENQDVINVRDSVLWGYAKTMAVEISDVYDGIIDLSGEISGKQLSEEIISSTSNEICIHNSKRYESALIRHSEFIKGMNNQKNKIEIKSDATYIITGGTGVVGRTYTRYLVNHGAKHIVLVSRKQLNESMLHMIDEYSKQGIVVRPMKADVCSAEDIAKMFEEINTSMPEIKGIIHGAGVIRDKLLKDMSWEDFEFVLNPKQTGSANMLNAANIGNLDFFIMISSISSIVGNIGQSNYAAANYFMNSLAEKYAKDNLHVFSCCWGPWQGEGMAASSQAVEKNMAHMGINAFSTDICEQIIEKFFDNPSDNLIIVDIDWNKYAENMPNKGRLPYFSKLIKNQQKDETVSSVEASAFLEELTTLNTSERKKILLEKLQHYCGEIMGFPKGQKINVNVSINEQGADSLMIFSMRTAINKMLNLDLNVSIFFNYPTLTMLADYLVDEVLFKNEEIYNAQFSSDDDIEDILSEIVELVGE